MSQTVRKRLTSKMEFVSLVLEKTVLNADQKTHVLNVKRVKIVSSIVQQFMIIKMVNVWTNASRMPLYLSHQQLGFELQDASIVMRVA